MVDALIAQHRQNAPSARFAQILIVLICVIGCFAGLVNGQTSARSTYGSIQGTQTGSAAAASASANTTRPLGTRAVFGLPKDGMQVNSIYIGFLPDWSKESPIDINRALGKTASIVGDYIYIGSPNARNPFSQMTYHSPDVIKLRDFSVYAPAILPWFSLDQWTSDLSNELASVCARLNQQGLTVWLRFAYEMNGFWMPYGEDPTTYISAYTSVWNAVQNNPQANQTYLLWSPNIAGGDVDSVLGYTPYYPGDDMVDIAGISYYFTGRDKMFNTMPDSDEFINGFDSFYKLYGKRKPIVISETSAPHHYEIPPNFPQKGADTEVSDPPELSSLTTMPATGSPSDLDIKSDWMEQMTSTRVAGRYPNLTAVSWFNYFKEGNNSNFNDFRAINGDASVESWFRSYSGNVTAYQGGFTGSASRLAHSYLLATALVFTSFVVLFL